MAKITPELVSAAMWGLVVLAVVLLFLAAATAVVVKMWLWAVV